jgi:hypothetical protein
MPDFGSFRGFGEKLTQGQTPTQLGTIGSVIFGVDPDAQAFFDRVTAAGGTLSATEQTAVNTLVVQMKADGTWTPMKAIYPMVGASAAACAQNLKSPSFTGIFNGGWTFASTGVTPNGSTAFMNTALNASTNLIQNSTHLSYYSRTNAYGTNQVEMGAYSGSVQTYLLYSFGGIAYGAINAREEVRTLVANPTTGFLIGNRTIATEEKYYFNNSSSTRTANSTGMANLNIYLGCRNDDGSGNFFSTKQCAFASIGDGLTDTQASDFYTAVQAFQTTLGRQV